MAPTSPTGELQSAEHDAADLARAVVRRGVQHGWPSRKHLDRLAVNLAAGST